MSLLSRSSRSLAVLAAVGGLVVALPAAASASTAGNEHHGAFAVNQVNFVSDVPGWAPLTDHDLVNPWGLALGPATPIWAANNASNAANKGINTATLYSAAPGASSASLVDAVRVTFPKDTGPTGQVFNGTKSFGNVVPGQKDPVPALFLFSSLSGQIESWNPAVDPLKGQLEIRNTVKGAVYTGLALATSAKSGDQLYASDFPHNRIDVFDSNFNWVKQPSWAFRDPFLPRGFGPFNVKALNGNVFVTYALINRKTGVDVPGRGLGFVDEFSPDGKLIARIASRQSLNAPWGITIAPSTWGNLAGALLIGNFGDGRINVVLPNGHGGFQRGIANQLRNPATGRTVVIPGLWALTPGTAKTGGTDAVWFSAGPGGEKHGLLGVLRRP